MRGGRLVGWDSFDADVVERLVAHDPSALDTNPSDGSMLSPLLGARSRLLWGGPSARSGTVPVGEPPVRFHPGPTFVHEDWRHGIAFGLPLLEAGEAAGLVQPGHLRLGHENGENGFTWNVFMGLREAGLLGAAAAVLLGRDLPEPGEPEPALHLWGLSVGPRGLAPWPELATVQDALEGDLPHYERPGPPDVALRLPHGGGWLLVDARLAGPIATLAGRPEAVDEWAARYAPLPGEPFDRATLQAERCASFPHRILAHAAYASTLTFGGRTGVAAVAALSLEAQEGAYELWTRRHLRAGGPVGFHSATWESLYALLPADASGPAARLRQWFERKSLGLRPAFPSIAAA